MKKPKKAVPQYAPATCTFDQLVTIRRDNLDVGDFWIMTDTNTVWLTEQAAGSSPSQKFSAPRSVFNKLIRWYLKPQKRIRPLIPPPAKVRPRVKRATYRAPT